MTRRKLSRATILAGVVAWSGLAHADDATWTGATDGNFSDTTNWDPAGPPDGTAFFDNTAARFDPTQTGGSVFIGTLSLEASAPAYTLTVDGGADFNLLGQGVINTSGSTLVVNVDDAILMVDNAASLGNSTVTLTNNAALRMGLNADGSAARIVTDATSGVDFSIVPSAGPNNDGRVALGSIEGDGTIFLDSQELTVGGNNLSTTFGGGILAAETSGSASFVKIGTGTLSLTSPMSLIYTGSTTIAEGTLDLAGADQAVMSLFGAGTITNEGAFDAELSIGNFGFSSDDSLFSGVIQDGATNALSVVIDTTGTVTFTGENTYTGGTLICDCSTLQIGDGGTTGSIAGDIENNNLLIFNRSNDLTYAGVISDGFGSPGSVEKKGAGTLTFTGDNTYTGGTTIMAGALQIGDGGATGWIEGDVLNDGLLVFNRSDDVTFGGDITGSGSLEKRGVGSLTLTSIDSDYTGTTRIVAGTLIGGDENAFSSASAFIVEAGATLDLGGFFEQTIASLEGAGIVTNNGVDDGVLFVGDYGNATSSTTFSGAIQDGSVRLGLEVETQGTLTLTGTNTYTFDTVIADGATLQLGDGGTTGSVVGDIFISGRLIFNRSDDITFSGDLTSGFGGPGIIEKLGAGTLTLSGFSDMLGTFLIREGTVKGDGIFSLVAFADTDIAVGATLDLGGADQQIGALSGAGTLTNNGPFDAVIGIGDPFGAESSIFSGVIQDGSRALGIAVGGSLGFGNYTLTLIGANTYTGGTLICDCGTLILGDGGTTGSIVGDVASSGFLVFNRSNSYQFDYTVTDYFLGGGAVEQRGSGTTVFTQTHSYTGVTLVTGGTLQIGNGGAGGAIDPSSTITVSPGATLAVNRSDDFTFANTVDGAGNFRKLAGNTLIFDSVLGNTGTVFIDAGTLEIVSGGNLSGAVVNSAILRINRNDAMTLASAISGTGVLNKDGTGTLTLTGTSTYSGATNVNAGTLRAGAAGVFSPNSIFTVAAGATLDLGGFGQSNGGLSGLGNVLLGSATLGIGANGSDTTFAGVISGTGGITKLGAGTLTLTGASSYSGATSLNGGTLVVNGSINNSTVNIVGGVLKGSGSVGGINGQNGGTVAPGNSIGTLNVAGNVAFGVGSVYQVEIDSAGASDLIAAGGSAALTGGTVEVVTAEGYNITTSYTILTAGGGVTGAFANVMVDNVALMGFLSYTANAVSLRIAPRELPAAATPNQSAVRAAITAGGFVGNTLFNALVGTSTATAQSAYDALSGEIHAILLSSLDEEGMTLRHTLLNRVRALSDQEDGVGFWADVSNSWGDLDGDGNAASSSREYLQITAGMDKNLAADWRFGLAAGYGRERLSVAARSSSARFERGHISAYAAGQLAIVNLRIGLSQMWGTVRTDRAIAFAAFSDAAASKQAVDTTQIFAEAGYPVSIGALPVELFGGLGWIKARAGAAQETGGSAALHVQGGVLESVFSSLGVAVAQRFETGEGLALTPSLRLAWQHAFEDTKAARGVGIVQTGQYFTVLGPDVGADRFLIDAGVSAQLLPQLTLALGYRGALSAHAADNSVRADLGWRF